jgi:hypothetical protein
MPTSLARFLRPPYHVDAPDMTDREIEPYSRPLFAARCGMTQGRMGVAEAATMAMPCSSIGVMRLPESCHCRQVSPSVLNRAVGSRLLSRAACLNDFGSFRHCQARNMEAPKRRRRAVTKLVPPPSYERFGVLRRCFGRESQARLRDTRSVIVRAARWIESTKLV